MPERKSALSASHASPDPLGKDNLLTIIEAMIDPGVLAVSLWIVCIGIEGELLPSYLILSVIVFATTFPGTSRLQSSVWRMLTDIFFNWLLRCCNILLYVISSCR